MGDEGKVSYFISRGAGAVVRFQGGANAKLVISDGAVAYVGSGELRKHSLTADIEVGVLLRGAIVKSLVDLFDAIWDKAEIVI